MNEINKMLRYIKSKSKHANSVCLSIILPLKDLALGGKPYLPVSNKNKNKAIH